MRNVIRITNKGKMRPVRRRALNAMPTVDDQASVVALSRAFPHQDTALFAAPSGLHHRLKVCQRKSRVGNPRGRRGTGA